MENGIRPVESVELTILVDNVSDQARPGNATLARQQLFTPGGLVPLFAEHGLCILVRLRVDGAWHGLLLDAGVSGTAAVHNADALGVDLGEVEAAVVSHGHADHTAGFEVVAGRFKPKTPLVIHPDAFKERFFILPDGTRLRQPRLSEASFPGMDVRACAGPTSLLDGAVVVTGYIPRTSGFEKGMSVQYAVVDGELVSDGEVRDDQALVLVVEGEGAVIVSGCAHAGIVNTARRALEMSGQGRILALVGGFHLCWPTSPDVIDATVEALRALGPARLVPLHCTGREAVDRLAREFPESFVMGTVGARLVLP